jgi:23S rRNA (cytosine1962-C5)-methyltransferase
MLHTAIDPLHDGVVEADEVGLPVKSNGLVLPCGASGRWTAK